MKDDTTGHRIQLVRDHNLKLSFWLKYIFLVLSRYRLLLTQCFVQLQQSVIKDGWAQKDKTRTGLNSYLKLTSYGIMLLSQVSGWRIIGEKNQFKFWLNNCWQKSSKTKSCKWLSTIHTQSCFRLVGMDNEIKCFANVCGRAAGVRDNEWFSAWGRAFSEAEFVAKLVLYLTLNLWLWVCVLIEFTRTI